MPRPAQDVLSSWKEISAHLNCSVRTAQRFQHGCELPINRMGEGPRSRVIAFRRDLDAWSAGHPRRAPREEVVDLGSLSKQLERVRQALDRHVALLQRLEDSVERLRASAEQIQAARFS